VERFSKEVAIHGNELLVVPKKSLLVVLVLGY
jgi:hypothetical protein